MEFKLPYGDGVTAVEVADDRVLDVIEPAEFSKKDLGKLLSDSLSKPCGGKALTEFIKDKDTILLILNDMMRPTPTSPVLELILPRLEHKDLRFVVATGSHNPPDKPSLKKIFGSCYKKHSHSILAHEARDDESLQYAGETRRGTSVYYNKVLWGADGIINVNSVEPHYFAGYTGGRKSFLPGVAGYKTITKNHSLALEEGSRLCVLDGNPVNEDMEEAVGLVPKDILSVNLVLDSESDIVGVYAGDVNESFRAACRYAAKKYTFPIKEKAEVVLAATKRPMSVNLYQTQKVIESGKLALKKGGVLVFISSCDEGVGPENYYTLMGSSGNPHDILMSIKQKYKLGYHKAARLLELMTWADLYAVTDLEDHVLTRVFMHPYDSAQEAVDAALKKKGPKAKLLYMTNSVLTVPVEKGG
jgi:nickel-dependent lactate racemase